MTQLSEHFTVEEAVSSQTAIRAGIDNRPSGQQLVNMKTAAAEFECVRMLLDQPIHINSWFRAEELEKILTAKDFGNWCNIHHVQNNQNSWNTYFSRKAHPQGFAIDFVCPMFGTPDSIVKSIRAAGVKVDQCIMEGTWVHISFAPAMRQKFMAATFKKGVPSYSNLS